MGVMNFGDRTLVVKTVSKKEIDAHASAFKNCLTILHYMIDAAMTAEECNAEMLERLRLMERIVQDGLNKEVPAYLEFYGVNAY